MADELLQDLERLVGLAADEIDSLRRQNKALERRVESLSRDLKARTTEARRATGWAAERTELKSRAERLTRQLEQLAEL